MAHQVEDQQQPANVVQIVRCSTTQLCDDHYYGAYELLHLEESVKSLEHEFISQKQIMLKQN